MSDCSMVNVLIIIPVYRVGEYIERCIVSVLSQTYQDIECIIVDDATPDNSIELCKKLIAAYQGPISFKFVYHTENRGLSAARNSGLHAATGEYVYFLDGDDEITSDCIEKLVRPVIEDHTIDVVQGNYIYSPLKGERHYKWDDKCVVGNGQIRDIFFKRKQIPVTAWNKLIRRDFLIDHHLEFEEGLLFEDILWSFCMMKYVEKLYLVSDVTYVYYKRKDSIKDATNQAKVIKHYGYIYKSIVENLTVESELMEVHHFSHGFCLMYIEGAEDDNFHYVHRRFMELMKSEGFSKDLLLMVFIHFLSKRRWTRWLIKKIKRRIYGAFC